MNPSYNNLSGSSLPTKDISIDIVTFCKNTDTWYRFRSSMYCQIFGGELIRTSEIHHGGISKIFVTTEDVIFDGINNPFNAVRMIP